MSSGTIQSLGRNILFIDDLLDRAQTSSELDETLIDGLIQLGADAVWLGRLVDDVLLEPASWAGEQIETYLCKVEMKIDESPEGQGPSGRAWRSGQPYILDDWADSHQQMGPWMEAGRTLGWRSSAAVPLTANGQTIALLSLYSRTPGFFNQSFWPFVLNHLCHAAGNALRRIDLAHKLIEQQKNLTELALRDPLTGLRNRVALEDHIQAAMARARRHEKLLAIGMLDLDEFKPINDTYGHEAGDEVLKTVAERINQVLRETDGVFRYGGDEFVLLIENLKDIDDLHFLLRRAGTQLNATIAIGQHHVRVGASLGIVIYPFGSAEENEAGILLRQADQALYDLKRDKAGRSDWWGTYEHATKDNQLVAESGPAEEEIPPYGPRAASLLESLPQAFTENRARPWIQALYQQTLHRSDARQLLTALSHEETEHLLDILEKHAHLLVDPTLDAITHRRIALASGQAHAIHGVEIGALMESYDLMMRILQRLAQAEGKHSSAFNALLMQRISLDLRWQIHAYHHLAEQRQEILGRIDTLAWEASRYADLAQGVVDALLDLDEVVSVSIGRPNAQSDFEFEFVAGAPIKAYLEALTRQLVPIIAVDPERREGAGPTARAWRSGRIERSLNYATDKALAPWRVVALEHGVHSSAAVPLRSPQGETRAVLTLYCGLPGGYSSEAQTHFLQHLQHTLGLALHSIAAREGQSRAVSHVERHHWRKLIERGLEMHFQPVIDLRNGRFIKVEALARLRDGENLLTPDKFLPTFTQDDLRALFRYGLGQTLSLRENLRQQGCSLTVSINLPTFALTDLRYVGITRKLLKQHNCPPEEVYLEVLENDEPEDVDTRTQVLGRLKTLGVRLSEDDLGAGYSSLHRLSSLPFDIVKIDQTLVRGILDAPQRLLAFIRQLTRLGHDLGMLVAVEGLETVGLIEAAAILGADMGQGFAIARPLSADALLPWAQAYANPLDERLHPRTPLGALAGFILWEEQLRSIAVQPQLRAHFATLPCLATQYIREQNLVGTPLHVAHERLHATAELEEPLHSDAYLESRAEFLSELDKLIFA